MIQLQVEDHWAHALDPAIPSNARAYQEEEDGNDEAAIRKPGGIAPAPENELRYLHGH